MAVQHSPFILIVGSIAMLLLAGCQPRKGQAAAPPPAVPVTTAVASVKSAPLEIRMVGAVEPSAKVEIKSQIAGQLISVHFAEGEDVSEGQMLIQIDPRPYREALRQAEAAVERDRAQLGQAEFAMQKDIVQSKTAETDAARFMALAKERIASEQQSLQYRTNADALKEAIRADQAAIESARASLKVDEAGVEKAKLDLGYCDVRAPISGRAGNLLVHAGNLIKVNDIPLVVINRIAPVFVSFSAPEKHMEAIRRYSARRKLPVEVTSRDDAEVKATGYLTVIDNTLDTQTGTIHLKATFDNSNRFLWPGQFVNVVLTLDSRRNATVIPTEAIQAGQKGQFVYVVKADRTVEARTVLVGRTLERDAVIESGVAPGETVVTDGQMLLFPSAQVTVVSAPKHDIGVH
jgi:multidrug efflux system membrane fusion protein